MDLKAVYKCRLCGEKYHAIVTNNKKLATASMEEMVTDICGTVPNAPLKADIHHCAGAFAGSMGLADFLGWEAQL